MIVAVEVGVLGLAGWSEHLASSQCAHGGAVVTRWLGVLPGGAETGTLLAGRWADRDVGGTIDALRETHRPISLTSD